MNIVPHLILVLASRLSQDSNDLVVKEGSRTT